ncbi:flavin reductase [Aestuariivivens sediminis]|uniref:flavin reductase n=1 Tax=Aestuariivivens sediminis TaxID=2913557 RepID=UPI001F59DCDB|nr:flavin reductase [Aestuariivivens sediminis]
MSQFKFIKEFIPIAYDNHVYQAVLHVGEKVIDITNSENILSISPNIFGFYYEEHNYDFSEKTSVVLKYFKKNSLLSSNKLTYSEKIKLTEKGYLFLFKVKNTSYKNFQTIKISVFNLLLFLKKKGKMEVSFNQNKQIISFFSIPRTVYLCSFTSMENQSCIFPIDLVIDKSDEDLMIFSIRKSNRIVPKLSQEKKAVIICSSYINKREILKLGKYHSKSFPKISDLEFKTFNSKIFNYNIPCFLDSYMELEIRIEKDIGQQIVFVGKVIHKKTGASKDPPLAHIHSLFHS